MTPAPPHRGEVFAGDFLLAEPIGTGGMGTVYVAEQLSTGKLRAVKIMHPQLVLDADLRERFEREARVGGSIDSEHVAEVVAAGVDASSGAPWIAMELLDGEDLDAHVARVGPLPIASVVEVFRQVCHALGKAHQLGVVHRDLKPENVFVARGRSTGSPTTIKLLDFGVAKLMAETRTGTATLGTPLWMSPEQSDPLAKVTPAADTWALGLLAFWLLTGKYYWLTANRKGASLQAILREILFEPLPAASERAAEVGATASLPDGFDAWFARCLARAQEERFQDAGELYEGLRALSAGTPAPALSLPPKVARATSIAPRPARPTPASRAELTATLAAPPRRSLAPVLIGLFGALALALGAFAVATGYVRFGAAPPAPEPSGDGRSSSASQPEPSAELSARATSEVVRAQEPTAAPTDTEASTSAAPSASASQRSRSPAVARRVFDPQAAHVALTRAAKLAPNTCLNRTGPRAVSFRVTFSRLGVPVRVLHQHVPDGLTETGRCAQTVLYAAKMERFDEPAEATVMFTVSLH